MYHPVQGHGMHGHGETVYVPFPFDEEDLKAGKISVIYTYSGPIQYLDYKNIWMLLVKPKKSDSILCLNTF